MAPRVAAAPRRASAQRGSTSADVTGQGDGQDETPLSPRSANMVNAMAKTLAVAIKPIQDAVTQTQKDMAALRQDQDQNQTSLGELTETVSQLQQQLQAASSSFTGGGGKKKGGMEPAARMSKKARVEAELENDDRTFSLASPKAKEVQMMLNCLDVNGTAICKEILMIPYAKFIFLDLEVPDTQAILYGAVDRYLAISKEDGGAGLIDPAAWAELRGEEKEAFIAKCLSTKVEGSKKNYYESAFNDFFTSILYSKCFGKELKKIILLEYTELSAATFDASFTAANDEFKANKKTLDENSATMRSLYHKLSLCSNFSQLPTAPAVLKITPRMGYSAEEKQLLSDTPGFGLSVGDEEASLLDTFRRGLPSVFGGRDGDWQVGEPALVERTRVLDHVVRTARGDDEVESVDEDEEEGEEETELVEVAHPLVRCVSRIEEVLLGGDRMEAKGYAATCFFVQQLLGVRRRDNGNLKGALFLTGMPRYDHLGSYLQGMYLWMQSPTLCPTNHPTIRDCQTRAA